MSPMQPLTEERYSPTHDMVEPAWEIARLFPNQGTWSVEEYLDLETNHLVEFSHGYVEVLPMPTELHQSIALFLYRALLAFVAARKLGRVLVAPLRVRLWAGKFREPDVLFMLAEHADRRKGTYWEGADLVMEVVSDDYRRHDLETKRREYARAGIPEYWIVDPLEEKIIVLTLAGDRYTVHGEFERGTEATSGLLAGFAVSVDDVLDADESD
jgi:Uma2 family endonuclease